MLFPLGHAVLVKQQCTSADITLSFSKENTCVHKPRFGILARCEEEVNNPSGTRPDENTKHAVLKAIQGTRLWDPGRANHLRL
jgi:hypothetical protein